jgi:hypothetical protein
VSRSNTQTKPCLLTCATTSIRFPAWQQIGIAADTDVVDAHCIHHRLDA